MGLIWVVSGMPSFDLRMVPFRDTGAHVIEYAVLAFLNARASRRTWPAARPSWVALVAAGSAFLWGYLDEIHQAFVPGRHASLADVAADAIGAVLGVTGYWVLTRRRTGA
jgi:VanZ family protein